MMYIPMTTASLESLVLAVEGDKICYWSKYVKVTSFKHSFESKHYHKMWLSYNVIYCQYLKQNNS